MREIKFRAWNVKEKYMDDALFLHCDGDIYDSATKSYDTPNIEIEEVVKSDFILMQYTGLKDKNGKEIYEGDMPSGTWAGGYLLWCDKCKCITYQSNLIDCFQCLGEVTWAEIVEDIDNIEIIGNIYENPELLKEEL
jgi:hypothetical protein